MTSITRVLGNRVLIEPIAEGDSTIQPKSDILVIPEMAKKLKPPYGRVVLKGEPNLRTPRSRREAALLNDVNIGDYVRVDNTFGSQEVIHDGRECRLVSIVDVQMVLPAAMVVVSATDTLKHKN